MTKRALISSLFCLALCYSLGQDALAFSTTNTNILPTTPLVRKQVRFWEKVFSTYPSTTVVIHDINDLNRVIDIIDYKSISNQFQKGTKILPRKTRDQISNKYLARYEKALKRFKKFKKSAIKFGPIEKRIYAVYRKNPLALRKLYQGKVSIRAQAGLADDFKIAKKSADKYFPIMESIFAEHNVPKEITRLIFVESMFNINAYSKVGAAGIWQFMPTTAQEFMNVNHLVDERRDPIKSTRAAAKPLAQNYRIVKSWPHAITAYNHGATGMKKAIKKLGTRNFDQTLKHYRSKNFGFASQNFYAELIAAINVYDSLKKKNGTSNESLPKTEVITLTKRMSLNQIINKTPLSEATIKKHNPCLLEPTYDKYRHKKLPKNYQIRVPRHLAGVTKITMNNQNNKKYARR